MGHFWLWVALALYSVGLAHAILTVVQRREKIFRVAKSSKKTSGGDRGSGAGKPCAHTRAPN